MTGLLDDCGTAIARDAEVFASEVDRSLERALNKVGFVPDEGLESSVLECSMDPGVVEDLVSTALVERVHVGGGEDGKLFMVARPRV